MKTASALIYWVVVAVWLSVLVTAVILYLRNRQTFGTTRLLLVVVAIDTARNIVENSYFGVYFGGQFGLFPPGVTGFLGNPYLLVMPKALNIIAGCLVLGVLLLRWLPHAVKERADAEKRAEHLNNLAMTDGMTGLWNRRQFMTLAKAELQRASRHGRAVSLIMLDIDNFKAVNDRYGHNIGDAVIVAVAETCQSQKRFSDIAARLGGEEFAMLLPESGLDDAGIVAERLREAIGRLTIPAGGGDVTVTISLGVTEAEENISVEELLRRADIALYQAKRSGRNRVAFFGANEIAMLLEGIRA